MQKLFYCLFTCIVFYCTIPSIAQVANNAQAVQFKVMSFNILYGGDDIDFDKVIEAIKIADADVVGIQEPEGNIKKIAIAANYPYYSTQLHVISKHPLISPPGAGFIYTYVEVTPGKIIAISNTHLTSDPYGPEMVRDGMLPDSLLQLEMETRYHELDNHCTVLPQLIDKGIPVFLTGDFNCPSYRDWTSEMVNERFQIKYAFEWPVSKRLEASGFRDSYREIYPNPKTNPGLTWTPGYPGGLKTNETFDRIDFVWAAGPCKTIASIILGEENNKEVSIAFSPWGSDHRAVMSTFLLTPVTPEPYITTASRNNAIEDSLTIYYYNETSSGKIEILMGDKKVVTIPLINTFGKQLISVADLNAGKYKIVIYNNQSQIISTNEFVLMRSGQMPELHTLRSVYESGESIAVTWENAPGSRLDWIGIYPKGINPEYDVISFLSYKYTKGEINGTLTFDENAINTVWPIPAGEYEIHLLLDDGYKSLTKIPITIK